MASDAVVNLKGAQKAQALVDRFGLRGFDYAGNAKDDLPVWRQARNALSSMPRLMIALCVIALPIVVKLPIGPLHIGRAIIVSLTLVYLVLFGNSRYHFPMMIWVAMYSGLGVQVLILGKSSLRFSESGEVAAWDDMKNG